MKLKQEINPYLNKELDSLIVFKSRQEKWLDKEFWGQEEDKTDFFL
jgi:CRISPR-associated protein Cas2